MQASGLACDSPPRERRGQRCFHLPGDRPPAAGDELHWTGRRMNCTSCADCHATGWRKNFPAITRSLRHRAPSTCDESADHFHGQGSAGARCAACHMPTTAYMTADRHHGHFIRVPRPDRLDDTGRNPLDLDRADASRIQCQAHKSRAMKLRPS